MDTGIREAMKLLDILVVQVGSTQSRAGGSGGDEMHSLPNTIYDDYNGIVAIHV